MYAMEVLGTEFQKKKTETKKEIKSKMPKTTSLALSL